MYIYIYIHTVYMYIVHIKLITGLGSTFWSLPPCLPKPLLGLWRYVSIIASKGHLGSSSHLPNLVMTHFQLLKMDDKHG